MSAAPARPPKAPEEQTRHGEASPAPTVDAERPDGQPQLEPPGDPALVEDREAAEAAVREVQAGTSAELRPPRRRPKLWLGVYVAVFGALLWAYPMIGTGFFLPVEYGVYARRLATVLLAATVIQGAAALIELFVAPHVRRAADRYNLLKVTGLISWSLVALVAVTQLFDQWYTAVASLGLVSLVLGLALQEPISSFFAWIYILIRQPYRVGDRIQIKDLTGDVIQVGYLDTTLWEFGGPQMETRNHPSGRIIKFPNATVLNEAVINYTWPLFPYIWDDINFHIGYDSDFEYVASTMQRVVEEAIGQEMLERVTAYRELLAKTPVDQLTVQERPQVVFRVHDNTWIEVIVRYVVNPRQTGSVKNRLIPTLIQELNKEPHRVRFPKGDAR